MMGNDGKIKANWPWRYSRNRPASSTANRSTWSSRVRRTDTLDAIMSSSSIFTASRRPTDCVADPKDWTDAASSWCFSWSSCFFSSSMWSRLAGGRWGSQRGEQDSSRGGGVGRGRRRLGRWAGAACTRSTCRWCGCRGSGCGSLQCPDRSSCALLRRLEHFTLQPSQKTLLKWKTNTGECATSLCPTSNFVSPPPCPMARNFISHLETSFRTISKKTISSFDLD